MIHILIVDDHLSVAEGTKLMIEQEEDMKVTILNNSIEALDAIKRTDFDVIIIDLKMPKINGFELAKKVKMIKPDSNILIYTGYDIEDYFNMLIEVKVSGFISKTSSRDQIVTAIRSVLRGDAVIPISLMQQLRIATSSVSSKTEDEEILPLNSKELSILKEVSLGKNNKEIANKLYLSQRTVEYHLTNIFRKLNVKSRVEAVYKAQQYGLLGDLVI